MFFSVNTMRATYLSMLFVGLDNLLRNRPIYDCISSVCLIAIQPNLTDNNCLKVSVLIHF